MDTTTDTRTGTATDPVEPFTVGVGDDDLQDLHRRLDATRWPDSFDDVDDWASGVPAPYLRGLVERWRNDFDWRRAERRLNEVAQFTTTIDGQTIHFLHV